MKPMFVVCKFFVLFISFISFTSCVLANQFENLYQGNIIVEKQGEQQLKELALQQVLIKVSGNSQVNRLDESQQLLKKTQNLLSQFGYRNIENNRYFMAVFDPSKINQALKEMGQPVWGETRPRTLVWLIVESEGERKLISDTMINGDQDDVLSLVLKSTEQERGINLRFPLMDLDDNLAVSLSDVSGRFFDQIALASERYDASLFSVANLKQKDEKTWDLEWVLVYNSPQSMKNKVVLSEQLRGEKSVVLSDMTNKIADYYADQYAILATDADKFSQSIYISGISSLQQHEKLNQVLSGILAIASYEVVSVDAMQVKVNVKVNGGINSFENALNVQTNLQLDASQSEKFHFNWR
ncbi:DUF2066 domain-containing protein [Psychromonas sp. MB-3u-54]|uniref:DUF2066 domain-containing protein n=1 Tax=Psychromonas sp. MB-3u-54 TaxID=2058319 RepID=UPI001E61B34A|nr:DUF2066 domain-containing protein [Psychromonas sp. MB-3u-54]